MRILHVIAGLSDGGAEAVLYRLITNDSADQHHVISLTDDGKYGQRLRNAGAMVTPLSMPRGRVTLYGLYMLWRVVCSYRPDVVQTWMYHADLLGGIIGRLVGVPVVWGLRNTILRAGKSSTSAIWAARLCACLSALVPVKIVACAQAALNVHADLGYKVKNVVVIPNGYDLSRFRIDPSGRERLRIELGMRADLPLIGMVARFDPYKDHDNLIRALGFLHARGIDFRAVMVGAGVDSENKTLISKIDAYNLSSKVRLLGQREDVPELMNAFDINVLSSSAEAFPNVLAEAMACSTPCVSTDVGDAASIIGETGWLVPPSNSEALADTLERALADWANTGDWLRRKRRCRQKICDEYDLQKMIACYREVWASAASLRIS